MGGTPSTSVAPAASPTPSSSRTAMNSTTPPTAPIKTVTASTSPTPRSDATPTPAHDIPTTSAMTEGTSQSTFYSVARSLTLEADKPKPSVAASATRWYNWTKQGHREREKSKALWYMNPPVTIASIPTETTTTSAPVTTTFAPVTTPTPQLTKNEQQGPSDERNISATPSFQLRSTAVYSPPHGDRMPLGRRELTNTDVSNLKYYHPDERSKQPVGVHTRATMYRMNTLLKETPLPTQSTSSPTTRNLTYAHQATGDLSSVRTYVSRGLQTDLEPQAISASPSQMRYYEKQQSQVVPLSVLSNYSSSHQGFYHLPSHAAPYESNLPPIGPPSARFDDQPPSYLLANPSALPPPTSILKKSSTVLSREQSNPLAEQTRDQVVDELRKRNKNLPDGMYRVKKVHLLEKSEPPRTVTFNLPRTKASQSILRSQRLFAN